MSFADCAVNNSLGTCRRVQHHLIVPCHHNSSSKTVRWFGIVSASTAYCNIVCRRSSQVNHYFHFTTTSKSPCSWSYMNLPLEQAPYDVFTCPAVHCSLKSFETGHLVVVSDGFTLIRTFLAVTGNLFSVFAPSPSHLFEARSDSDDAHAHTVMQVGRCT